MMSLGIGFFADGPWAHKALEKITLDPSLKILFICARYDSPDLYLRDQATQLGVNFICEQDVNTEIFLDNLERYACDLYVSMSFNQIFKKRLINIPKLKTINCHAGNLPFYRGRNILNWVLINDEKEFGITTHYVDEGIDTGDIILKNHYSITDNDDYSTLLERAYDGCAITLYESIKKIQANEVRIIKQIDIDPFGSYCIQRKVGDERLNWNQSSRNIFNFTRAICSPGPQARTFFNEMEIKINKVQYFSDAKSYIGVAGSVISVSKNSFTVKTLDSFVRVIEWSDSYMPRIGDRLK